MSKRSAKEKIPRYFYVITLFIPIALVALLELGLRIASIGSDQPLFIEAPEFSDYYYANPRVIERYVGNKSLAPKVAADAVFFAKDKSANTFRIFVQGGSTAAGFPYGRTASLQGMLYQRFKRLYPDKKIEIISTAMAAVNSYTLLDFVDEIIEQKPDLILVYAGHNEFLGVMGVGSRISSSGSRWLTLALIKARKSRLFQAIEMMVYSGSEPAQANDKRTLMSKVVRDTSIVKGSDEYRAGVLQFRTNLSDILEKYRQAKIPVAIANLVTNEQDQPPFASIEANDWPSYLGSLQTANAAAQIDVLQMTKGLDDNATVNYQLGLHWALLNQHKKARVHFKKARDLDALRFRAPSDFNNVITQLAIKHDALIVDVEKELLDDTDTGILGSKHLLEHVHPNERGYFLIAEALSKVIQRASFLAPPSGQYSKVQAWADNPVTKVDRLSADYVIEKLLNDYPFVSTAKEVAPPSADSLEAEALSVRGSGIDWRDYRLELSRRYQQQGEFIEAAEIAAGSSDAIITDAELANLAGQRYMALKDYSMARYYHQRATRIATHNRDYWLALAEVYFRVGDTEQSAQIMTMLKRKK